MDRQCSSCGGFCRKSGCERENVKPEQEPVAWMEIEKYIDEDNLWDSRKILRDYDNGLGEPLYAAPLQREQVKFPTMLRKMWSGSEVQAWLDENVNKEKNT